MRTEGLDLLLGQTVCALVYESDLSIDYDPLEGDLQGDTRGILAFDVVGVGVGDPDDDDFVLPTLTIQVVDAVETCGGQLEPLEAPIVISSSEPPQ